MLRIPEVIQAWSVPAWAAWNLGRVLFAGVLVGVCAIMAAAWIALRRLRKRHTDLSSDLEAAADERRRAVQALRHTEALYYSLVETLPQNILRKDLDGIFTFANRRFCAELGRSLDQILGRTDFDFYPRELAEKYRRDDRRVIESGQVLDVVEQHVTPQGETLYVQVMKSPIFGDDGKPLGIQGIFWDVTARIRAEEQLKEQYVTLQELAHSEHQAHQALKQAQSRLVQTEKLASLGQLVAGVAHEINNPLSFVSNNVAVLERDLADLLAIIQAYGEADRDLERVRPDLAAKVAQLDERIDLTYSMSNLPRLIERTREGLRRIERIVKELRLFARVDEGEWNEVDLNPGIESSINIIKGYARKKGVKVAMDLGAMPAIRCRAARIHQVIVNLLTNAIDACGEQGEVQVRTRSEPEALGIRIDVSDNGCGMDPETRDHIFDPFFTTKPIGQGTGLGLSISYGIIEEHDGSIEVQSTAGGGSCFTVHLPLEPRRKPPSPAAATGLSTAFDSTQDATIVEDHPREVPTVAAASVSEESDSATGDSSK
ncbi:Sensor protein ZraS [Aquisphaera giovannonii]|uniref:histidine kinase n=1 Tax=Aquisphaera giovannonii TaxID=406548 RepID=A0A5B9VZB1_9BACT|nr:ATP-binding protein [Aquisphaera giovannonii]QEH33692.1 Sensor protein ZraS [Aquisphaera giovannonii]